MGRKGSDGDWVLAFVVEVDSGLIALALSFAHPMSHELPRRNVSFPLGIVYYGRMVDGAAYARRIGATWACPNYHFVDASLVEDMHAHGVKVMPWTPNREREWTALRAAGCDGIITDLPAEAVLWREGSAK